MSLTATLNESGHVILPAAVLRLFDVKGGCQLDVDVRSDGVTLRFARAEPAARTDGSLWFTPFTQPAGTPPIRPEVVSQALAEDGF